MDTASLPTTVVGLIAFITVANVSVVVSFIRYIQKKNGHLERISALFASKMDEHQIRFDQMLSKQSLEHNAVLEKAYSRLEDCNAR